MAVNPIRPEDIAKLKEVTIPDAVLEAFNELITENYRNGRSSFKQKDVVSRMVSKGVDSAEAYRRGWLDIEPVYEGVGWRVEYDKPGHGETYDANFTFVRVRKTV